ncbi:MAG: tRNA pseudouridine(13) synthase TruD [Candidatus Aenigmarchaeota archaeon]|nr:tRNA pseudouridine(13) synthase TruD [Candidatus Aenigmarchaeota archaeon]
MKLPYWTRSAGAGGKIKSPEDFIVKELLHRKYFARYATQGGVRRKEGKYGLFLLKKRNMTTRDAVQILRRKFGGPIGFAGLKDKKAVTEQYITMREGTDFLEENIELRKVGTTDSFLSKGDLLGNEFIITLHGCNAARLEQAAKKLNRRGFPNYFGPQRFGSRGNNHFIGRNIVKRKFKEALRLINKSGGSYSDIRQISKDVLKFYVNAYQSWLFNAILGGYVRKGGYFGGYLPVAGFSTKRTPDVLRKEKLQPKDFIVDELRLACSGARRKAFIKTCLLYTITGNRAVLRFRLPAGSYATAVLREITKVPL